MEWQIVSRHAYLLGRRWRGRVLCALLGAALAVPVTVLALDRLRAERLDRGFAVRLTTLESHLLGAARAVGIDSVAEVGREQLAERLTLSNEATRLALLLDRLPKGESVQPSTWWRAGAPGRLGVAEALAAVAEMLSRQPPDRRESVVRLLEEFGRSTAELRSLLVWASLLPEAERVRLRSLNGGVLSTERGRVAFLTIVGSTGEQFSQCQQALRVAAGSWQHIQRIVQRPSEDLSMLSRIGGLPAAKRAGLFDVVRAYEGPAEGHSNAPYPCLDRPTYEWRRGTQPLPTCTIALP